jgi:methylsterol monooxygenase/4,4-dimethyl-9beta,19-cyclopropylsterol-4alpha-methyl oxidase
LVFVIVFLVVPLPLFLPEQLAPAVALRYKLQPQSPTAHLRIIIGDSAHSMLLVYAPHQLMYLIAFKVCIDFIIFTLAFHYWEYNFSFFAWDVRSQ